MSKAAATTAKRSYTAQKKDIKTLLGNPKITFVLGILPPILKILYRWTRLRQGHPMRETS